MKLVDLLRAIALLIALLLLATRRRMFRTFQRAEAYDEASAIALPGLWPVQRWWQSRLKNAGVLRGTADERYWMDRAAWQRYRAVRRRRGLTILACLVTVVAIVFIVLWRQGRL